MSDSRTYNTAEKLNLWRKWLALLMNDGLQTQANRFELVFLLKMVKSQCEKIIHTLESEARSVIADVEPDEKGVRTLEVGNVRIRKGADGPPETHLNASVDRVRSYLKGMGIEPEVIERCISRVESVDVGRLESLVKLGYLPNLDDLMQTAPGRSGSFTIQPSPELKAAIEQIERATEEDNGL
jgi:hypothetical protein